MHHHVTNKISTLENDSQAFLSMAVPGNVSLAQSEYIDQCLISITPPSWLVNYHQAQSSERPFLLKTLSDRLSADAAMKVTIVHQSLELTEEPELDIRHKTNLKLARRNATIALKLLQRQEQERRRIFEGVVVEVPDQDTEEWHAFCKLSHVYKSSLMGALHLASLGRDEMYV
jgi:hypothetical protein